MNIDNLAKAKDGKNFKSIIEKLKINSNKQEIKKYAIEIYKSLKGKKQKSFFKDAQISRFLGKEMEEEIKNIVKD